MKGQKSLTKFFKYYNKRLKEIGSYNILNIDSLGVPFHGSFGIKKFYKKLLRTWFISSGKHSLTPRKLFKIFVYRFGATLKNMKKRRVNRKSGRRLNRRQLIIFNTLYRSENKIHRALKYILKTSKNSHFFFNESIKTGGGKFKPIRWYKKNIKFISKVYNHNWIS